MTNTDLLTSLDELERHYDSPRKTSRVKQSSSLTPAMQTWLSYSTFFMLNTCSDQGLDCSPRGDKPGEAFRVLDENTIAIPDRRGNNRIDTLRNLIDDPRIGLLFMIPGIEQTLRIKGRASISMALNLRQQFVINSEPLPPTVLLITVTSAYVQNARAIRHAGLWDSSVYQNMRDLPTAEQLSRVTSDAQQP